MILSGVAMMLLPACNGMFAGIYDEPETANEFGFTKSCSEDTPGIIYINATDYTRWTYINFENSSIDTLSVYDEAPEKWDIAIHRYDVKTNGGSVAETALTDISLAAKSGASENLDYVDDEWTTTKIVTDMSTMMDGYLSYAESFYNPVLSRWLDVDTSEMPPIYTSSGRVYILSTSDGRRAALKLQNYMDASGVKGYMTIEYIYPL